MTAGTLNEKFLAILQTSEPKLSRKFRAQEYYVSRFISGKYRLSYEIELFSIDENETIMILFFAALELVKNSPELTSTSQKSAAIS